jgi:hypothetical protein
MRTWFFCLALASFGASAQSVYKCVDKGGVTSFQSEPCSDAAQVKKTWDATPEPLNSAEQQRIHSARKKSASDAAYLARLARGNAPRMGAVVRAVPNRCEAMKRQRDNAYEKNPKRNMAFMRYWGDKVHEACK